MSAPLRGTVLAVCIGPGGIPKCAVEAITVSPDAVEGDGHRSRFHGGRNRAVCLFSIEDYRSLRRDRVSCEEPGTFGENVLTEGLDFTQLRAGDELWIGDMPAGDGEGRGSSAGVSASANAAPAEARALRPEEPEPVRLAIHDVRSPCGTLKSVDRRFPDLMLGRSGFVCRVVTPGIVRPGMSIVRA